MDPLPRRPVMASESVMERAFRPGDASAIGTSSTRTASAPVLGFVSLAGAGPGDPELLTVKALHRIRMADAVVYDALIPQSILALIPAQARAIAAGKRNGARDSASQESIDTLLADLATDGLRVVRLKGGDPLVFGRGGEEALFLEARGIPYEIVPGISAAHGAAAAALLPLTHRAVSRSCTIVEGHELNQHRVNWRALVELGGTWVFYMGKAAAQEIAAALVRHGADPQLPAAIVENATLPDQSVWVSSLSALQANGYRPRSTGPGLVLVGLTVALFHEVNLLLHETVSHDHPLSDLSGCRA